MPVCPRWIGRQLWNRVVALLTAITVLLFVVAPGTASAAAASAPAAVSAKAAQPRGAGTERPIGPQPVYSGLAHGGITMAANSVVTCTPGFPCDESASNATQVAWVKVDPLAPGNTASSSRLNIPAGAVVLNARLYWQFNPVSTSAAAWSGNIQDGSQVSIKVPGSGVYQRITASTYDWFDALGNGFYPPLYAVGGAADVTGLVTAAGAGDYTVADIQACQGQSVSGMNWIWVWVSSSSRIRIDSSSNAVISAKKSHSTFRVNSFRSACNSASTEGALSRRNSSRHRPCQRR